MSGTDTHAQPTTERPERPERGKAKVVDKFVKAAAEEAYKNAVAAANMAVDSEVSYDSAFRKLAKAGAEWIWATYPQNILNSNRRMLDDDDDERGLFVMPEELMKYRESKGMKNLPPHAVNPFIADFQYFCLKSKVEKKLLTQKEATEILDAAYDPVQQKKARLALNVNISRWAKLMLAAIDRNDAAILNEPLSYLDTYDKWRKISLTLSGKPKTIKPKDKPKPKDDNNGKTETLQDILNAGVKHPVGDDDDMVYDDPTTTTNSDSKSDQSAKVDVEPDQAEEEIVPPVSKTPEASPEAAPVATHRHQEPQTSDPQPITETNQKPDKAEPLAQSRPESVKAATEDWFSFANSFDHTRAPVSVKFGKNVMKEIGLDEGRNEEFFLRCKIQDGEMTILGVRHGTE
jgi:hypothetical protein